MCVQIFIFEIYSNKHDLPVLIAIFHQSHVSLTLARSSAETLRIQSISSSIISFICMNLQLSLFFAQLFQQFLLWMFPYINKLDVCDVPTNETIGYSILLQRQVHCSVFGCRSLSSRTYITVRYQDLLKQILLILLYNAYTPPGSLLEWLFLKVFRVQNCYLKSCLDL